MDKPACSRGHESVQGDMESAHIFGFLARTLRRMANLGFVGLGVMGSRMVNRLLDKGHTVTGYNRTRAKAQWLIDRGMKWADSPRAVAAAADVTLSMVTNSAALEEIADGADGIIDGLGRGKIWIDMS